MKRRSFLKTLGIATACVIIQNPTELLSVNNKSVKSRFLKITHEIEQDIECLKSFIKYHGLRLSNNDPQWESKTTIQIGFYRDDFARGLKTLRMDYVS